MSMLSKEILDELYINKKLSSSMIASRLKCSENKVNYWLEKYAIPKRSISDAMYIKYNPKGDPFVIKEPKTIDEAILYGLGIGLYWGEGNKKNKNSIRLGNTDPQLVKKFIEFLEKSFNVKRSKLKFWIQIFSDISPKKSLKFWQKELNVLPSQFGKVTVTQSRGVGTYKNKMKYGVLTVYFNNTKLRDIMCKLIKDI